MPFLNHRLRTLQTESFRNLDAAFSPSLFLFLSLNFVPKYLKISFLPLCIYKNVEKNRAKTGHFLLQFLPSNHNILWSNMPIFLIFHNTASELPTQHGLYVGNNRMYHAGNPIGYADLTGSYWQQHLAGAGRIKK